jgi:acetolactate synthase I/II/III large subunit
MTTVGVRLVEGLRDRGVDCVFGIPGVHTIELYRGLAGGGLRHVTPRHEQGAGFMADGYARVSGRPGVAFVITGPGLTNTLTAMGQAAADSVPILVISGVNRRGHGGLGLGLLHELPDQSAMVRALCRSETLTDLADLGPALDRAFAAMRSGRPGPVHLEIPTDVMGLDCPPLAPPAGLPVPPTPDPAALDAAAQLLSEAVAPVILAGGGAARAEPALRQLAETLDAPVILTTNARGLMHRHPLAVPASPSLTAVRALIAGADRVVAIGTEIGQTDYDMYANGGLPDLSGMIRIDISARDLALRPAAVTIEADALHAAEALAGRLIPRSGNGAARAMTARTAARAALASLHPAMPAQLAMVEAMHRSLPRARIVGDSTQPVYAGNLFHDAPFAQSWFNAATGFGALGYGPGAAVGAAIADPTRPVICLIGDGGLQFSPGELRTARDENLDVTFVVWNNAGFREIAEAMAAAQTAVIGCTPSPLALEPFAAACGLPFAQVPQDPAALAEALLRPHDGPRMIEVQAR